MNLTNSIHSGTLPPPILLRASVLVLIGTSRAKAKKQGTERTPYVSLICLPPPYIAPFYIQPFHDVRISSDLFSFAFLSQYAIQEFIRSLVSTLSATGLAPRATTLFTQAMAAGNFRWGRKAKLVAGACISVALRESKRPDSLRDIAFLLDETPLLLTRTFSTVTALLNLALTTADPALHISSLQSHLSSMLQSPQPDSELPAPLLSLLKPLSLRSVTRTANSLANLLARLGESIPLAHLPTPPTACALLLLALEAEARTSFTHLSDLAHCLGVSCHVGKGVVMSRYKMIQDVVAEWINEVPWLEKYECKKGRAKIAKRLVVARGLKDIVQFQEEIWRKKLEAIERPRVVLEVDNGRDQSGDNSDISSEHTRKGDPEQDISSALRPRKQRKTRHALQQATQFLLNPLAGPLPFSYTSTHTCLPVSPQKLPNSPSTPSSSHNPCPSTSPISASTTSIIHIPLTSYLLAASPSNIRKLPTRLQLLAVMRGGAGPEEVDDDELFEEDEWTGIFRGEEERQKLRDVWGWGDGDEDRGDTEERVGMNDDQELKKVGKGEKLGEKRVGTKKVNMDALAKFLEGTDDKNEADVFGLQQFVDVNEDDEDNEEHGPRRSPVANLATKHKRGGLQGDTEVVTEGWRSLSPDIGASHNAGDRYDEEYD